MKKMAIFLLILTLCVSICACEETEKEKKVILLYYYEELTLKEISELLEVTESRVSQLHTKSLQKMKAKLGKYVGILNAM